ncbi:MAG: ATP phosphoribosyltransferase regulatory subunit [Ruminococcus sp.]|nr:ATP phosphoribosyltransferase regulatory subunit [Ruminococcus sp.]
MRKYDLITPEGTKDFLFEECLVRRETEKKIHDIFRGKGYYELTTPALEFFDVFQTESGHYPQERLYKLTDSKGRLLVMRPESTMPIARVVATRLKDAALPLRLYYNQSVYRFESALKGRSNEIVQTGIELIGSASHMADLEMVSTAIEVLESCSETSFSLEIGDAGVFKELMRELKATEDERENIRYLIETKNYPALNDLLDTMGDSPAIAALKRLPAMFGGEEVFDKAAGLYSNPRINAILDDLRQLYGQISQLIGKGRLTVDLGMVNNADYYTGVIIKGYLEGYGEEVLSGGRYNKLLADYGYDIPATGFGVNVDAIAKVAIKENPREVKPADVLLYAEPGFEMKAIALGKQLRAEHGYVTEFALLDDLDAVREYAREKKIGRIIVVNGEVTEV